MDAAKVELLRALGRVVRGLSTLFWGLPLALVIYVETARSDWLNFFGGLAFIPAIIVSVMLCYGLHQLRAFQKQERIWHQAIRRAELFAVVNAGLSPFLFWWHRFPFIPFYIICVGALVVSDLFFLIEINRLLRRLCAMLPDEMLRVEAKTFTALNIGMLLAVLFILGVFAVLQKTQVMPYALGRIFTGESRRGLWLIVFLTIMPMAITMSLLWKIKEVIFTSIFEAEH